MEYVAVRYVRGTTVDLGCGDKPWEALFAAHVTEHIGVDRGGRADIIGDAQDVPLPDESADTVLFNEVLEHLEEPAVALAEAFRLLRPGGYVIVDTPFMWPVHEAPRDFFRYSPFGLRHLLESNGFEVVEILPLTGAWVTISLLTSYALQDYQRGFLRPVIGVVMQTMQRLALRWEQVDFQPRFSTVHLAVGRKPMRRAPLPSP